MHRIYFFIQLIAVGNNIVDLGAPDVPIDPDAYRLTTPEGQSNVYDSRNTNLLTLTDALLNTTAFFWDAGIGGGCSSGASLGTEDALLNRTTIQPQCIGPFAELPAYQEDARGVRTSFGYDALGRQISETTTRTDTPGVVQSLTTTLVYDDKGRVTQVTDAAGNITRTEYNAIDKASARVDANGNRTEFDYDAIV